MLSSTNADDSAASRIAAEEDECRNCATVSPAEGALSVGSTSKRRPAEGTRTASHPLGDDRMRARAHSLRERGDNVAHGSGVHFSDSSAKTRRTYGRAYRSWSLFGPGRPDLARTAEWSSAVPRHRRVGSGLSRIVGVDRARPRRTGHVLGRYQRPA